MQSPEDPITLSASAGTGNHNAQIYLQAVFIRVTIAVMNYNDQSNLGRKVLIWLMFLCHSSSLKEVKTRRNLETGADTEIPEECLLPACSSWFAQFAFL